MSTSPDPTHKDIITSVPTLALAIALSAGHKETPPEGGGLQHCHTISSPGKAFMIHSTIDMNIYPCDASNNISKMT